MDSPVDETFVYAYMWVSVRHTEPDRQQEPERAESIHFPSSSEIPSEDAEDPLETNFIQLSPKSLTGCWGRDTTWFWQGAKWKLGGCHRAWGSLTAQLPAVGTLFLDPTSQTSQ